MNLRDFDRLYRSYIDVCEQLAAASGRQVRRGLIV